MKIRPKEGFWSIISYMSFEDNFLKGIDRKKAVEKTERHKIITERTELPAIITQVHERLKKTIWSNPKFSIQAPEFMDTYGKENVIADMQKVLALRKKWDAKDTPQEKNSKLLADVLEGMVLVNARENSWLGDSITMKTSLFDDVMNGTDMFTEWYDPTEGSRVLALAVDITYSKMGAASKLRDIKEKIDSDSLGQIRYFKDMRGDFKGTRNNVPRTIVGISPDHIQDIAALWMRGDSEALRTHPIQRVLIEEIFAQTQAMADYAHANQRKTSARAYEEALSIIGKLRKQKESIPSEGQRPDKIAAELIQQTKVIFG